MSWSLEFINLILGLNYGFNLLALLCVRGVSVRACVLTFYLTFPLCVLVWHIRFVSPVPYISNEVSLPLCPGSLPLFFNSPSCLLVLPFSASLLGSKSLGVSLVDQWSLSHPCPYSPFHDDANVLVFCCSCWRWPQASIRIS